MGADLHGGGMFVATLVMGLGNAAIRLRLRQGRYDARVQY